MCACVLLGCVNLKFDYLPPPKKSFAVTEVAQNCWLNFDHDNFQLKVILPKNVWHWICSKYIWNTMHLLKVVSKENTPENGHWYGLFFHRTLRVNLHWSEKWKQHCFRGCVRFAEFLLFCIEHVWTLPLEFYGNINQGAHKLAQNSANRADPRWVHR